MANEVTIRRALVSEQKALEALQRRASLNNPGDREALLTHPEAIQLPVEQLAGGQVFVAEDAGTIRGFAAIVPRDDGNTELDALFVEPGLWRRGYGRRLIEHCGNRARALGSSGLHVIANPHAEDFYVACGFERYGTTQTQFGVGWLMRKPLDQAIAPAQFETDRLVLTLPRAEDADAVFRRYASDPEVTKYLGWPRHNSIDDTRGFLAFSAAEWERSPAGPYLIRARSDGRLLGGTGFSFPRADEAMTGYVLAKDAWGQGYATEALKAMVEVARRLDVTRIFALCHPDHRASWHVLEKCGFTRDVTWSTQEEFPNLAPGVLQDVFCYERRMR